MGCCGGGGGTHSVDEVGDGRGSVQEEAVPVLFGGGAAALRGAHGGGGQGTARGGQEGGGGGGGGGEGQATEHDGGCVGDALLLCLVMMALSSDELWPWWTRWGAAAPAGR